MHNRAGWRDACHEPAIASNTGRCRAARNWRICRPLRFRYRRAADLKKFNHHEGEEWLYVLEGRLGLVFANEEHWLESGDSVHFDARIAHRLVTDKSEGAKLLLVASAAANPSPPRVLI